MSRIVPVISGIGLVTPLGSTAEQTWSALMDGQFIRDHARIPLPLPGIPGRGSKTNSRAGAMALHAASEALRGLPAPDALIVGTSKGSIENWISHDRLAAPLAGRDDGAYGLSDIATELAREFGIAGPRMTLSAACASGLHALIRGAMMIQSGQAQRVLVVAAEASVHPLFLGSFRRLGVLPPEGHGCRPFDESRAGFLMSEAAAAVYMTHANKDEGGRMKDGVAIERYALGGDATHLTGGDGEARTLRYLLERVAEGREVDLVHAHATGTKINDPTERSAIESVIACSPHLYSHKGALGHSLGAAGLVSVALNCMIHQRSIVPPNVRTPSPIPGRLVISNRIVQRKISRSIAIASGFGGPTAVVGLVSI